MNQHVAQALLAPWDGTWLYEEQRKRLERAAEGSWDITVRAPTYFYVKNGGNGHHYRVVMDPVKAASDPTSPVACDCVDACQFYKTGIRCKHVFAVILRYGLPGGAQEEADAPSQTKPDDDEKETPMTQSLNGSAGPSKIRPEIAVYTTAKNFLNLLDAVDIGKVQVELASYDKAAGKQTARASFWLDVGDARLVAWAITNGEFKTALAGKFEAYGGSEREGKSESRVFRLEEDPGQKGEFAKFPYRLTVSAGPGKRVSTSGIAPDGEPTSRVSMRLPSADLVKLCLTLEAYLDAHDAANFSQVRAEKVARVARRMAERQGVQPAAKAAQPAPAPAKALAVTQAQLNAIVALSCH